MTALRFAPTVPIDVMKEESKNLGTVEKAVQIWEGQFRTLNGHIESELDAAIPKDHPVLQWCTWCAAQVVNAAAVNTMVGLCTSTSPGTTLRRRSYALVRRCTGVKSARRMRSTSFILKYPREYI